MDIERKIAIDIMKTVKRLRLPLVLDELTEGKGDCFPLAIMSQCRRSEINIVLSHQIKCILLQRCPTLMRKAIRDFMMMTKLPAIENFKRKYDEVVAAIDNLNWFQYWEKMTKQFEWIDYTFIQSTAWFLGHDIIIVTTTGTQDNPYVRISGNMHNEEVPCSGPPLIIGCKSDSHYQSLLPLNGWMCNHKEISQKKNDGNHANGMQLTQIDSKTMPATVTNDSHGLNGPSNKSKKCTNNGNSTDDYFIYNYNNNSWNFKVLPDKKIKCPICRKNFKNVHHHLQKSSCNIPNLEDIKEKLNRFNLGRFDNEYTMSKLRDKLEVDKIVLKKTEEQDTANNGNLTLPGAGF